MTNKADDIVCRVGRIWREGFEFISLSHRFSYVVGGLVWLTMVKTDTRINLIPEFNHTYQPHT